MPRFPRVRGVPWSVWPELLSIRRKSLDQPIEVLIAIADHFEPDRGSPSKSVSSALVDRWIEQYPPFARRHRDSFGRHPKHTFFFPIDQYDPEHVERLARLCDVPAGGTEDQRLGDVEIHLHHHNATSNELREQLEHFKRRFHDDHGVLREVDGAIRYGFVHGNWALDNSHSEGAHCGVNDELTILRETGCYADFTMPSAPADCQTRTINSIYYAIDDPHRPKSHDCGIPARVDQPPPADGLLMIQGPLALDWSRPRYVFFPAIENGAIQAGLPPTLGRLMRWLDADVHVAGRPEQIFVKLHTHGAVSENADMLLGDSMHAFHHSLAEFADSNPLFRYRYVTAWEMAGAIHAPSTASSADRGIPIIPGRDP